MEHSVYTVAPFIDPRWFREMRGGPQEGVVVDARTIQVKGQCLALDEKDTTVLVPGEAVFVWIFAGNFRMETATDRQARQEEERVKAKQKEEAQRQRDAARRAQAAAFYESYAIPVPYTIGDKPVLSGLTENSNGDGRYASSVSHLLLKESLAEGRLKREAGLFLCAPSWQNMGSYHDVISGQESLAYGTDSREPYMPQVTCKACLRLMERWKKR